MKILSLVFKILVVITLVAIGIFVYQTCSGSPLIQRIDKTLPDATKAPFSVATVTRLYYAQQVTLTPDNSVMISGWYERDGQKWVYHKETITLPAKLRPRISRR